MACCFAPCRTNRPTASWCSREVTSTAPSELERLRYREQDRVLARFGTYFTESANLTGGGSAERVVAARVDADVLPTLGMAPRLGRVFTPDEDVRGNDRVVVLAHALWQRRFGADPGVLGQSLVVDGSARVVVGVTQFSLHEWSRPSRRRRVGGLGA